MGSSWQKVRSACLLASIALCVFASGVVADEEASADAPDYGRTGLYVAVNFGAGIDLNLEDSLERLVRPIADARLVADGRIPLADPLQLDSSVSGLVGLRGGWRFHRNFATELELRYRTGNTVSAWSTSLEDEFDDEGDPDPFTDPVIDPIAEITSVVFTPNVRAYALTGRIQPYATTGFGLKWLSLGTADGSGGGPGFLSWVFRVGGGVEYYLAGNVGIDIGAVYNLSGGDLKDTDYIGVVAGMFCRF